MITSLEYFTLESTGFDLLETGNNTPSRDALWFRKQAAEHETRAKEYLAKKSASSITPFLVIANNWIATIASFSL